MSKALHHDSDAPSAPVVGVIPKGEKRDAGWSTGQTVVGAISILGFVWLIYLPALHGTWLWDDNYEVASNPLLPAPDGLVNIWAGQGALDYFPLKATVQWILWRIWGANPTGWHAASIALHGLNALLVWRLLSRLGIRYAWLGGLLFAVHPLAVESVAWIAELKNLLSLSLALLSFLAYLRYDATGQSSRLRGAVLLFLGAMLCKSTVVMLPCVLVLFLWWKHGARCGQRIRSLLPFFAVALVLGLVTIWFQYHRAIAAAEVPVGGPATRIVRAGVAVFFYGWKAIFPIDLMPVYPAWPVDLPIAYRILAWPALGAFFVWLWLKQDGGGRHVLFGVGAFVLGLAPILGFVAMAYMHASWVADHFVYPALPAIAALFAGGVGAIRSRLTGAPQKFAVAAIAGLVALLATLSWDYASIFRSPAALWNHAVERNPNSAIVHNNLGIELVRQRAISDARAHFETALRLNPELDSARNNLRVIEQEFPNLPK